MALNPSNSSNLDQLALKGLNSVYFHSRNDNYTGSGCGCNYHLRRRYITWCLLIGCRSCNLYTSQQSWRTQFIVFLSIFIEYKIRLELEKHELLPRATRCRRVLCNCAFCSSLWQNETTKYIIKLFIIWYHSFLTLSTLAKRER